MLSNRKCLSFRVGILNAIGIPPKNTKLNCDQKKRYLHLISHSYGHLLVIVGYFNGIMYFINGVLLVLVTGIARAISAPLGWGKFYVGTIPLEQLIPGNQARGLRPCYNVDPPKRDVCWFLNPMRTLVICVP